MDTRVREFLDKGTFGSKDLAKLSTADLEGLDLLRNQIFDTLQETEYSGANGALSDIFRILNFYSYIGKELLYEVQRIGEQETELGERGDVIGSLSEDLDVRFKTT